MVRQAVILAGGKGTRLRERLGDLPKPMVPLAEKPLLEHQISLLKKHGFLDIVLLVGYRAEKIEEYFGSGSSFGVKLRYVREPEPRGTAGAVFDSLDVLSDRFVVLYGDTMLNVDLSRFYELHASKDADATLFLHPNDHPEDSDLVETDDKGWITGFHSYPHDPNHYYPNLVNAALYVIEKKALFKYRHLQGIVDFAKVVFPMMVSDGGRLFGYCSPEYIKDVGTPDRIDKVEKDYRSGRIMQSSLDEMAPAIFLDRDGTLNVDSGHIKTPEELNLIEGVAGAIRRINQSHYRTAIVTNQPVIARGDCDEEGLKTIHNKLETLLGRERAYVDAIYYCPHHPHHGFEGERKELKFACFCRKPAPGLLFRAATDLNIDITQSWMIGDSAADISAARNAGVQSILLRNAQTVSDKRIPNSSDYEFYSLPAAIDFIIDTFPSMLSRAISFVQDVKPGQRIVLGGLSGSGKSTWASVIRHALRIRGMRTIVISLDRWLKSENDRGNGGVMERFDLPAIKEFVQAISSINAEEKFLLPKYDRATRTRLPNTDTISIDPNDIVIFDGVIGLAVKELEAEKRIFVECDESLRKQMVFTEYDVRGYAQKAIQDLYDQRQIDESPLVLASRNNANIVLQGVKA